MLCFTGIPKALFCQYSNSAYVVHFFSGTIYRGVHRCGASGSGPGFDPRSGQVSWVRFFRGFSSPVRQMLGNFRPPTSPSIIWPSSSSFHIRHVGMTECVLGVSCLSCLCCLGGGPGIGLVTRPGRLSMSLCGRKSMYVIYSLIPSLDRSWLCNARAAWVT